MVRSGNKTSHYPWIQLHQGDFSRTRRDNYLHYIYNHAGIGNVFGSGSPEQIRQKILNDQRSVFVERMKQNVLQSADNDIDVKRMMNLYSVITGKTATAKKLESYIQEQFNGKTSENTAARSTGIQGTNGNTLSFAALGQKSGSATDLAGIVQNLGEQVSQSMGSIRQAVDECIDSVRQVYPGLVKLAMKKAADAQEGIAEEDFLKEVLKKKNKTLIKIEKSDQLSAEQATIVRTLGKLEALVNAISVANNGTNWNYDALATAADKNIGNLDQLLATLIGKIGGNLSSFSGGLEEIAVAQGFYKASQEGAYYGLQILDVAVTGSNQINSYSADPLLERIADESNLSSTTFQKNDVTIVLSKNGLVGVVGLSVKTSKNIELDESGNIIAGEAKLQDSSPLLPMLQSLAARGIPFSNILQLAGGKEEDGDPSLYNAWRSMVDLAVYNNFLTFLSGKGTNYFDNSYAMVLNGHIVSMYKILGKIATGGYNAIQYIHGKRRYDYEKYNSWERVANNNGSLADEAEKRSSLAISGITSALQATKITVTLNFQTLGGL